MLVVAVPLLALKFGASAMMLGTLGWAPQILRLPVCLTSGHLSERFGRKTIMVPAVVAVIVGSIGVALADSSLQILLPYVLISAGTGFFYPPLQALVGDTSARGELRRILGWFNMGWCTAAVVSAWIAVILVAVGLRILPYVGAGLATMSLLLVVTWRGGRRRTGESIEDETEASVAYPKHILTVARLTHFTGFFGITSSRILFPKLAQSLGWTDSQIAGVLAMLSVGLAGSVILCNASAWWRGKIWPQVAAQLVFLISAVIVLFATTPVPCAISFCGIGAGVGVAYTTGLYHGIFGQRNRGKNTGIHEGLVAAGCISGSLLGGWTAEEFSLRAPFALFSALSVICLVAIFIMKAMHRDRSTQGPPLSALNR